MGTRICDLSPELVIDPPFRLPYYNPREEGVYCFEEVWQKFRFPKGGVENQTGGLQGKVREP